MPLTPIVLLALGWVAGLWLAAQWPQPVGWLWGVAAGLAGAGLVAYWRNVRLRPPLLVAVALALGAARYAAQPWVDQLGCGVRPFIATFNDHGEVVLEGVVWAEPDERETSTLLRVKVETILPAGASTAQPTCGDVLLRAERFSTARLNTTSLATWQYGDRVRAVGALATPVETEDFSYRDVLARQGVYSQMPLAQVHFVTAGQGEPGWALLLAFKAQALTVLARLFPEPHAALLAGILLGVETGIPATLKDAFSLTGTSHIVAISGFNIAIIVSIFSALAERVVGKRWGWVVAISGVAFYTVLVGMGASVVRAAIMGSLVVVAQRLGRSGAGLNTLAAAVIFMTLGQPLTLWDVGFQLSVAATAGLVLFGTPAQDLVWALWNKFKLAAREQRKTQRQALLVRDARVRQRARGVRLQGAVYVIKASDLGQWPLLMVDGLALTGAAQLTTLGLLVLQFRQLSFISLLTNMLILPVQPLVMVLGGVALFAGLLFEPMGQWLAWAVWPFTAYTVALVQFFARTPLAAVTLGPEASAVALGLFIVSVGLYLVMSRPAAQRPGWWGQAQRLAPNLGLLVLIALTLLAWSSALSQPDPTERRLRITVLEVGQGEAVLVQTPSGNTALINGGPTRTALARALARQLPLFANQLDVLVLTSPQERDVNGLPEVLARFHLGQVIATQATDRNPALAAVRATFLSQSLTVHSATTQPSLALDDGVVLRVVTDTIKGSVVQLEWKDFSLLLPGPQTTSEEAALLRHWRPTPVTALLLAQNGSDAANHAAWLQALDPQVVLVAVGAGNSEQRPAPRVVQGLAGYTILRTDEQGDLTLETDGQHLWVETAR